MQVKNLAERLRSGVAPGDGDRGMLFIGKYGGFALTGAETAAFSDCAKSMVALYGSTEATRTRSKKAVQHLLQTTLARIVRPARDEPQTHRQRFERRMAAELRALRRELARPPEDWRVTVRVDGLKGRALPLTFGGVEFQRGSRATGKRVAAKIVAFAPTRGRHSADAVRGENESREKARKEVLALFSSGTIATVIVAAFDYQAAKQLGVERVRRTVDAVNFFAPFFAVRDDVQHRAFVPPEGERSALAWATDQPGVDGMTFNAGHRDDRPIWKLSLKSRQAKKVGIHRASLLLADGARTALEDRIVNALAWAGRARVESRADVAFMLYAIALESLLTKPSSRTGVTERLRLRVAYLLGRSPKGRQSLYDLMGRLYDLRSEVVHGGDARVLAASDLEVMSEIVETAIVLVLKDKRFRSIRDPQQFERWFEDRMLA